jgi:hypothetical protein
VALQQEYPGQQREGPEAQEEQQAQQGERREEWLVFQGG